MIIYHPQLEENRHNDSLVQTVDLFPTIMEFMQEGIPAGIDGKSLLPLLFGSKKKVREMGLYSRHGDSVNVTDGEYTLFLMDPQKHQGHSRMYNVKKDPQQRDNIIDEEKYLAHKFKKYAVDYLNRVDAEETIINIAENAHLE
ncbi:MAG: sulfatase/phosphatase domain-containing protein [Halanaerobiaceae bacterium]